MSAGQPSETPKSNEIQPAPWLASTEGTVWSSGPLAGLCSVLSGGLLAWLLVQAVHPVFTNEEAADAFGALPVKLQWELDRNNSIFVLALLGGFAGVGLAVGEGRCRKSWSTALAAGAACGATGAAFGGLAGYLGLIAFQFYQPRPDLTDLAKTIRVYGVIFAMLGGGVGLAAGIFLGRRFRTAINCLVAGLLAGILAAITYPVIVAILMPGAITKVLIPIGAGERLLWFGLIAGLLGVIIPSVARERRNPSSPSKQSGSNSEQKSP